MHSLRHARLRALTIFSTKFSWLSTGRCAVVRPIENRRAWLLGAPRKQIRKRERLRRRHAEQLEPAEVLDIRSSEALPGGEESLDGAGRDKLGEIVAVLSKREEEVLMLRLASMKYREIGKELGTARGRFRRCWRVLWQSCRQPRGVRRMAWR
jgi:DNA-directed RNA polymerase specialized sigma24 family protein